jgi:hypothetical protein
MSDFTIETSYLLPVFRRRVHEAETAETACQLAIDDGDWFGASEDRDGSGVPFVSGLWPDGGVPYRDPALPLPERFRGMAPRAGRTGWVVARVINRFGEMDYLCGWDETWGTVASLSLTRALRFATEAEAVEVVGRAGALVPNFTDGRPIEYRAILAAF